MSLRIRSYGAARTVTGSNHLLELGGARLLLDCGLFQGSRALDALNDAPLGYDPAGIDALLLSHAHLDHAGRLPLLVRQGFAGPILALPATRALAEYLLLDAAKLQREDYERDLRKGRSTSPPLFDENDVASTLALFEPLEYDRALDAAGLRVTPRIAGHIPGSASFLVEGDGSRLVFSGDVGNARKDVLPDPAACPPADVVLVESTYGDRDHRSFPETIAELASVVRRAADRGGKIMIPSFALERTHDVLYHIARLEDAGEIPSLPVFVDSPLAIKVDGVYDAFPDEFSDEVDAVRGSGRDPFAPRDLRFTRSVEESKAINEYRGPAIVVAGSGMLTGGRILHHLVRNLGDANATLVIVGFQPEGGLGRLLIDGRDNVRILGKTVNVRAGIATIGGLSAHADRGELLAWLEPAAGAEVRLVHGEVRAMESLVKTLSDRGIRAAIQEPEVPVPARGRRTEGD